MKVYEIPLTLAEDGSDIKIKHCCVHLKIIRSFVTRLCAYNGPRYQVSFYRIIGSLVLNFAQNTDCVSSNVYNLCFKQL